jgi:hypothetical protein
MVLGPSDKLSRDILALDREQCRLVTGLLRPYLHVMGLSESAKCRKCGWEKNPLTVHFVNAQFWLGIEQRSLALHGQR